MPAPSGIRTPADRIIGLTISPGRSPNCSTRPSTPARMKVLSRSTCASASAASALAFSAGSRAVSARSSRIVWKRSRHRGCPGDPRRPPRAFRCRAAARCRDCASAVRAWCRARPDACCSAPLASWSWPSAFMISACARQHAASTSAILRLAVSSAASCFALSSLKSTSPS